MERPAVVRRALLDEIAVLDHLLHVVGDVGAEAVAALGELADGELLLADVEQDQRLDVVQVADALAVEVGLDDLEALAVEPLDQPAEFEILSLQVALASPWSSSEERCLG